MRAPERVVELDEPRVRRVVNCKFDAHFFAPERPAFVENRVREKPPQFAWMPVLNDELHVMARIALVRARELEAKVLPDFRAPFFRVGLLAAQVVDPENAG